MSETGSLVVDAVELNQRIQHTRTQRTCHRRRERESWRQILAQNEAWHAAHDVKLRTDDGRIVTVRDHFGYVAIHRRQSLLQPVLAPHVVRALGLRSRWTATQHQVVTFVLEAIRPVRDAAR